jgi:hypothetical protein
LPSSADRSANPFSAPTSPNHLRHPPDPIEAFWLLPDDPLLYFTWRRRRQLQLGCSRGLC